MLRYTYITYLVSNDWMIIIKGKFVVAYIKIISRNFAGGKAEDNRN